jgi:hypothetical protein
LLGFQVKVSEPRVAVWPRASTVPSDDSAGNAAASRSIAKIRMDLMFNLSTITFSNGLDMKLIKTSGRRNE